MIARVARVILPCHAAAYAQERTNNAFGVFEQRTHQPTVTGVVIAAPHGTFDSNLPLASRRAHFALDQKLLHALAAQILRHIQVAVGIGRNIVR